MRDTTYGALTGGRRRPEGPEAGRGRAGAAALLLALALAAAVAYHATSLRGTQPGATTSLVAQQKGASLVIGAIGLGLACLDKIIGFTDSIVNYAALNSVRPAPRAPRPAPRRPAGASTVAAPRHAPLRHGRGPHRFRCPAIDARRACHVDDARRP